MLLSLVQLTILTSVRARICIQIEMLILTTKKTPIVDIYPNRRVYKKSL